MNRHKFLGPALLLLSALFSTACGYAQEGDRKNIIVILADDLGYGDLGCYGQQKISTPNIDRLAAEGIRFTDFYAGSTVCAPSRSCFLTGLHTGHTYMRGNSKDLALRAGSQDLTLASHLRQSGYATAMIGKSCVSCGIPSQLSLPEKKGFDHFFGLMSHWEAHHYFPPTMYRNSKLVQLSKNFEHEGELFCHDLYLDEAKSWLKANAEKPFFMLYSCQFPHASMCAPEQWIEKYRGKVGVERDSSQDHYRSTKEPKATFAAMVSRLDWEVGQIVKQVEELGLEGKTAIFFTSDNGAMNEGGHLETDFQSSGQLRGVKRDLYEGGIRVPLIVRLPGIMPESGTTKHVSAFWDFFPTICDLAATKTPQGLDGISFYPTLLGRTQPKHKVLYWEFFEKGGRRAVRFGDIKAVQYDVHKKRKGPIEIFDLSSDISECNDIAHEHPELVAKATEYFGSMRTESPIKKFNFRN